jgi:hypothetical protein
MSDARPSSVGIEAVELERSPLDFDLDETNVSPLLAVTVWSVPAIPRYGAPAC